MDVIKEMNGQVWIFAIIEVGWVCVQAFLFLRLALNFNKKNRLFTNRELKSAAQIGAVATVGPALSTIVGALSLLAMMGSGTTFMRLGVIGSPQMELMNAQIASSISGVTLGGEGFTKEIFVLCLFCMGFSTIGGMLNTILTLKPLDYAVEKAKTQHKKGPNYLKYLTSSAIFAVLGYNILNLYKGLATGAAIAGAIVSFFAWDALAKKIGNRTMSTMGLPVGMVMGMLLGQIVSML